MHSFKNQLIVKGNKILNDTGGISFVNDFEFKDVRRFYHISVKRKGIIRAFHGHMKEKKYVYVAYGKALICIAPLTHSTHPNKNVKIRKFVLNADDPKILCIPEKHANGFKSLEPKTQLIFFSDKSVSESKKDDYRFDKFYFGKEVWKTNE